ncbi:MAG: SpoVA/SpoVAEb family sporulation membrane protein [Bacilli bacterium]|nr:SpoVA/SpoVAEb family sporulation membrane protein [Bacilli bacterium]
MEKLKYQKLVNDTTPKPKKMKHSLIAFISGGLLGAICEILKLILVNVYDMKITDASSIIIFILVIVACFMTAFFDFDKWVIKFKAGLIVPITGFAHSIQSSALDYKKDGLITGLGANFFKLAGSVILYGIVSAFIFCLIKVVFYG